MRRTWFQRLQAALPIRHQPAPAGYWHRWARLGASSAVGCCTECGGREK